MSATGIARVLRVTFREITALVTDAFDLQYTHVHYKYGVIARQITPAFIG